MNEASARLRDLVESSGGRLYRLLTCLALREDVADDLLQDLVVRLSQSQGFLQAKSAFAYARQAAIHLAFDWRRQGKSRRRTGPLAEEPLVPAPNLLGKLVEREEFEQVLAALEQLSSSGRNCLVLHYIEQLSYAEIAEQFEMTPHQVRAACHKGIRRIRGLLAGRVGQRCEQETFDDRP